MSIALPHPRRSLAPAIVRRVRAVALSTQTRLTVDRIAAADLLGRFESLGDNCEFASLQKAYGVDIPSLFKWRSTSTAMLNEMIVGNLQGLDDLDQLRVELRQGDPALAAEYMLFHRGYQTHAHTFVLEGEATPEVVLQRQHRSLVMLKRKFLQDLREGRRTYVFRSLNSVDVEAARDLAHVLRSKGPNSLLFVRLADDINAPGSVVDAGEGLLIGHLDTLAGYDRGMSYDSRFWLPMLRLADRLRIWGDGW